MAVRDGVVAWLGSDEVGRAQFPDAQVVDLDGAFVAPAFVDSHVHLTATGLTLTGLDLRPATSLRHCLQLIDSYARAHPDGPIWGYGWDESGWPERMAPSTDDLDGLLGDRPAYLARVDVHSAAAPTALRRLAPGLAADIAIFDAGRVGSTNRGERRFDLPGGAKRMVMPSRGVEYTLVNGVVTWADGKLTGAAAGEVLRS